MAEVFFYYVHKKVFIYVISVLKCTHTLGNNVKVCSDLDNFLGSGESINFNLLLLLNNLDAVTRDGNVSTPASASGAADNRM
jgi:hypothetical protein